MCNRDLPSSLVPHSNRSHSNNFREDSKNSVKNGIGRASVVQTGNDTDLYDAAIEPSGQHASATMSVKSETPSISRQASNASVAQSTHPTQAQSLPALGVSNQSQGGRRYCCYIGECVM